MYNTITHSKPDGSQFLFIHSKIKTLSFAHKIVTTTLVFIYKLLENVISFLPKSAFTLLNQS